MKVTPWFPCTTNPVRAGVYQTRLYCAAVRFREWDGKRWFHLNGIPCAVFARGPYASRDQWRGLAEKPE